MAINVAEYQAKFDWDASSFDKGVKQSQTGLDKFKSTVVSAGKSIAVGFTTALGAASAAVVKIGKDAITAYADYEQLVGGVETLFGESADIVIKNAEKAYKTAGLSANGYMETVTSFSASLLQSLDGDTVAAAKKADMAIVDMSDNANKMGSNIESIQNAYQGFAKQNYTMLDNLKLGYGGTKEEMARLLADAEKISGIKYDLSSYSDIVDAIHVVQTEMGITGTTAKEASTTIQGSISSMKAAWTNLLTGLTDESQDFNALINNLFESIITVGDNLIPRITVILNGITSLVSQLAPKLVAEIPKILNQVLPALVNGAVSLVNALVAALPSIISALMAALPTLIIGVQQLISGLLAVLPEILITIVDTVISIIPTLIEALIDCLPALLDCVLQLITGLAQGIIDAIPILIAALPEIINSIITFLLDSIPQIIQTGIQLFTSLIQALPQIITAIVAAIPQIIDNLITAIIGSIPQIVQSGIDLLVSLIQNLPTIIKTILKAIPQIITSLVNAIANNIPAIIQAGVELLVSLVKNLPKIIVEVVKAIPQIITSLVSAIIKGVPQIANAGLNLVKGLFNGISNAVGWLYGKLKGWVSSVLSYIKGLFGIHSPSKETAVFGKYIAEGLGVGIEENADAANKAAETLADNVLTTFEDMADNISNIEDDTLKGAELQKSVKLSAVYDTSAVNSLIKKTKITSDLPSSFSQSSSKLKNIFDGVSISGGSGITNNSKIINIKMGDINVSGVIDKGAAEQVDYIVYNRLNEFSDEIADVLNNS